MAKNAIIEFKNVDIGYKKKEIVSNINLKIEHGEYIGIIGPNGSGKSTFLKTLLGLLKPIKGKVIIDGRPLDQETQNYIGYVPQSTRIDREFPLLVEKAVLMGRYGQIGLFKRPNKKDEDIAHFALHQVHMHNYKKRPIGHLSGGEQQKVMIARALAREPELLLLDEPTSALDFQMTHDVFSLVDELNKKYGLTILMVHHDIKIIREHCNRLLIFGSKIQYDGPPNTVEADGVINRVYRINYFN